MDSSKFMEEVLTRLARIEAALSAGSTGPMAAGYLGQIKEAARQGAAEGMTSYYANSTPIAKPVSLRQQVQRDLDEHWRRLTEKRAKSTEIKQKKYQEKMEQPMAGQLLNSWEAATFLNSTIDKLYLWRSAGKGPRYAKIGRSVYYKRSDLEEYLMGHNQKDKSQ